MVRLLESGSIRRVDLGRAGDRRFLLLVSSGFDAMVTHAAQQGRSGPTSYASWILPILGVLRRYRPPRLRIRVDEAKPVDGELVIVSNVRNYGGLFTVADRARCDSGQLDACILTRASFPRLLRAAAGGLTGGLSKQRGVVYLSGTSIEITANEPVAAQIDGEPFGTTPLRIHLDRRITDSERSSP
jgi:diacylglycerol kinase family enzyme